MGYNQSAIEIRQTPQYARWFSAIRDIKARARIDVRIRRLQLGNAGDAKSLGEGLRELRIDYGPGYRVYYVQCGHASIVLLTGGHKGSQDADIRAARRLAQHISEDLLPRAKAKTKPWNVVDHLRTEKEMAAYLEAALEEGDAALVGAALGDIARARGMAEVARKTGLGRESLYKSLSRDGNPELATVLKVIHALGIRLHARAM